VSPSSLGRRRSRFAAATALVLAVVLTTAAGAASRRPRTVWVVDNTARNCSNNGPGTAARPLCAIKTGAKMAAPGDTVHVRAGTYRGTSVNPARSNVTFTAHAGVTIRGGTSAFAISKRRNIRISGFTITRTSSYGISVSGGRNVTISANTESYAGTPVSHPAVGIYVHNLAGGLVSRNVTHDNSAHGIFLNGTTTGVVVKGNTSYHNAYQNWRNANGIDDVAPGNSIIGNRTYANEDSGINIYPGAANTLIANNVSYDNGDHGIDDYNVTGGRIIGNTLYSNCTTGINVEGTSSHYLVEHNIAVNNATGAIVNPTPIATNPKSGAPDYTNGCNRRRGNIGIWDSAPLTTHTDYNLVYQSNGTSPEYVWAGAVYNRQQTLYAATGEEAHGILPDPHLQSMAP
jgi:parallel beta-helix repeat protein